ncbi:spore coat protein U domain-containing protein [Novosphingobium pokkalii]|uniref:Spore coat protein U domain-containing protein n=1 Tax=Novosphingobium pokkalii TaxID=1770194 RepID=A0ABV7UYA6_9SPHN|nr:spore coat protein U domain-containing protein [Novosphingobium pokkalii]GHC97074.1 hypothetical protein GCM10019060_27550 [Novosphingobium pokkalii]
MLPLLALAYFLRVRDTDGCGAQRLARLLGLAVAGMVPATVQAEPLNVSVQVPLDCAFETGSGGALSSGLIDFGTTGAAAGQRITAVGTVYVRCNLLSATPYVRLDYGQNANGSQRRLVGPSGFLVPYELRMGSAAAALWDDQPHSIGYGASLSQAVPIYGVITALPSGLPDGGYTDLVHLQLDY